MTAMVVMPFRGWSLNFNDFGTLVELMREHKTISSHDAERFLGLNHLDVVAGRRLELSLALKSAISDGPWTRDPSSASHTSWAELENRAHWMAIDAQRFPALIEAPIESKKALKPETIRILGNWGEHAMESYHLGVLLSSMVEQGLLSLDEAREHADLGVLDTEAVGRRTVVDAVDAILAESDGRLLSNRPEPQWNERTVFAALQSIL